MGWFTKKEDIGNKPNMPELPELPDNDNTAMPMPMPMPMPKSPNFPSPKPYSQEKEIINEPKPGMQKSRFVPVSSAPAVQIPPTNFEHTNAYTQPIQGFGQMKPTQEPSSFEPPALGFAKSSGSFKSPVKGFMRKDESLYIKLEKFQATMDAFREIRNKIHEIEELLSRTKEIKAREERELEAWDREIGAIKIKIDSIDRELFDKSE